MSRNKRNTPKFRVVGDFSKKEFARFPSDEQSYFRWLHKMLDEIFKQAANEHELSLWELAAKATLHYTTVQKLADRQTYYPQIRTVRKLAIAVGYELNITLTKNLIKKRVKKAG